MKIDIDLTGYNEILRKLDDQSIEILLGEVEKEVEDTIQLAFMESQLEVPVDTGLLRSTGKAWPVEKDGDGMEARITYGTHYGPYVHERVDIHHKPPTKAKFLEDPMKRQEKPFVEAVKRIFSEMLGGA